MLGSSFDWSVWPEWAAAVYRAGVALPAESDSGAAHPQSVMGLQALQKPRLRSCKLLLCQDTCVPQIG